MLDLPPLFPIPLGFIQTAAAVADTIVTIPASPTGLQRWVELITSIATIVIALALIVLAVAVVPAAWNSRRLYRRINKMVDRLQDDVQPLTRHAHDIADNLNYISTALRTEVDRLRETLDGAQGQLKRAAEVTEQRFHQFNALLEVVQDEAEHLFVRTASTLHGVQASARAWQEPSETIWEGAGDEEIEGKDDTGARPQTHS